MSRREGIEHENGMNFLLRHILLTPRRKHEHTHTTSRRQKRQTVNLEMRLFTPSRGTVDAFCFFVETFFFLVDAFFLGKETCSGGIKTKGSVYVWVLGFGFGVLAWVLV